MSSQSLASAGQLLVILPAVIFGGVSILTLLIRDPRYRQNPLRQQLWRAGHAHAGVLLILSLVALLYVDQADLSEAWKQVVRSTIPASAIFLPAVIVTGIMLLNQKPLAYTLAPAFIVFLILTGVPILITPIVQSARGQTAVWGVVAPIGTLTVLLVGLLAWLLSTMHADSP